MVDSHIWVNEHVCKRDKEANLKHTLRAFFGNKEFKEYILWKFGKSTDISQVESSTDNFTLPFFWVTSNPRHLRALEKVCKKTSPNNLAEK